MPLFLSVKAHRPHMHDLPQQKSGLTLKDDDGAQIFRSLQDVWSLTSWPRLRRADSLQPTV